MMLVHCRRNAVALSVEEPPIPLEGGFGRAPKHNAEIMRSWSRDEAQRTSGTV
jgi:hypothetical protein